MLALAPSKELPGCILGRIGSGEARAANGITHSRLGASHLRGVSVPRRTLEKAYVAEEVFAYSWDRAVMAYRVSSSRE